MKGSLLTHQISVSCGRRVVSQGEGGIGGEGVLGLLLRMRVKGVWEAGLRA